MKVEFDIKDFQHEKVWLIRILNSMRLKKRFKRTKESDEFFATSPALAYKYIDNLVAEYNGYNRETQRAIYKNLRINRFSPELEKVFSRSPKYALKYLMITGQKKFRDNKLNERILEKIYNNSFYSFIYANQILGKRIPLDKEEIFLEDFNDLYQYSKQVIKGRFDKKIDDKIKMMLFSNEIKSREDYRYLESYAKYADNPKNLYNVCNYYGRYF